MSTGYQKQIGLKQIESGISYLKNLSERLDLIETGAVKQSKKISSFTNLFDSNLYRRNNIVITEIANFIKIENLVENSLVFRNGVYQIEEESYIRDGINIVFLEDLEINDMITIIEVNDLDLNESYDIEYENERISKIIYNDNKYILYFYEEDQLIREEYHYNGKTVNKKYSYNSSGLVTKIEITKSP